MKKLQKIENKFNHSIEAYACGCGCGCGCGCSCFALNILFGTIAGSQVVSGDSTTNQSTHNSHYKK